MSGTNTRGPWSPPRFDEPILETSKGCDYKQKYWIKKKGQPTQEPSKKQQIVVIQAATKPTTPAPAK